jgi:hypothetical protein
MHYLLSSCLLKSLKLFPPFLICDLWGFCGKRNFIFFSSVFVFLVSLSRSVLLGLLLWRHRELLFGWNHGGRQCWGVWKSDGIPEHKIPEWMHESMESEETSNPRKFVFVSKVVNPFTCALEPPFIWRRRDFYIPRLPSNLENIPNVNKYMNVFYICWRWISVNLAMSLPLMLALIYYSNHWN